MRISRFRDRYIILTTRDVTFFRQITREVVLRKKKGNTLVGRDLSECQTRTKHILRGRAEAITETKIEIVPVGYDYDSS